MTEINKSEVSLLPRYLAKFLANIFALAATGVTYLVVPRSLGPQAFGQYSFFTSFFQQVFALLDFGAISAFFSKFSARQNEPGLATTYIIYLAFCSTLVAAGLALVVFIGIENADFLDGGKDLALLGLIWTIFWSVSIFFDRYVDALALTVKAERIRIVTKFIFTVLLLLMYWGDALSIWSFFFWNMGYFSILSALFLLLALRAGYAIPLPRRSYFSRLSAYFSEYVVYCRPLIIATAFGAAGLAADRWVLQYYGGSEQQGFFSLAWMLCSLSMIFATAFVPLFWREIAKARGEGNHDLLGQFMNRQFKVLFAITAAIGAISSVFASEIVTIMAGSAYANAVGCLMIMAFYPLHQVYGQLSSATFLSLGQTRLYAIFSVSNAIFGFLIALLLLNNMAFFNFEMQATAMAFKMVAVQALFVNVQFFFNCRTAGIRFWPFLGNQISLLAIILLAAIAAKEAVLLLGFSDAPPLVNLLLVLPVFGAALACLLLAIPRLLGYSRGELYSVLHIGFTKVGALINLGSKSK